MDPTNRDISGLHCITKFGPEVQNNLVNVPIVLGMAIDIDLQGQIKLINQNLPHFELSTCDDKSPSQCCG